LCVHSTRASVHTHTHAPSPHTCPSTHACPPHTQIPPHTHALPSSHTRALFVSVRAVFLVFALSSSLPPSHTLSLLLYRITSPTFLSLALHALSRSPPLPSARHPSLSLSLSAPPPTPHPLTLSLSVKRAITGNKAPAAKHRQPRSVHGDDLVRTILMVFLFSFCNTCSHEPCIAMTLFAPFCWSLLYLILYTCICIHVYVSMYVCSPGTHAHTHT
jgi:hypothetical protein